MPVFDRGKRVLRVLSSYAFIGVLTAVSLLMTLLIMSLRSFLMAHFFSYQPGDAWLLDWWPLLYDNRTLVAGGLVSIPQTLWIVGSNWIGNKIAGQLNEWENHRTELDFEDALLTKKFLIQFVNSCVAL